MSRAKATVSKWNIIKYLIKNDITPSEIIDIKVDNITKKGIEINNKSVSIPKNVIKDFGEYIKFNQRKIIHTGYIFPGRDDGKWTERKFLLSFRAYLAKNGEKLSDYGLSLNEDIEINKMDDILTLFKVNL